MTAINNVDKRWLRVQNEEKGVISALSSARTREFTYVNDRHKKNVDKRWRGNQTEKKGCRLRSFECEDKGVYKEVNDRSPNHEERAQDAPLSSVWEPN